MGRSNNEKGSVETGDRSGRPENEVFSDSGFRRGIEESPDDVNMPAKNETTATLSVKDGAIAGKLSVTLLHSSFICIMLYILLACYCIQDI